MREIVSVGLAAALAACSGASRDAATGCPDPTDPYVRYVSMDPSACARIPCREPETAFRNRCGCGCTGCPNETHPRVRYMSTDPSECEILDWACSPPEVAFDGPCGCGCVSP